MLEKKQYVKLGIFVVTVTGLMLVALAVIGGLNFWQETETYYVITDDTVEGVAPESPVTLRGVEVGEVETVELDRSDFGRVRVAIALDPEVAIPASAKAYFRRSGLTGEKGIDIDGGTLREGQILPGSAIPRGQTTLEGLESQAERVMTELNALTEQTNDVVAHVHDVVKAVDPAEVERIVSRTDRIAQSLESASDELGLTIAEGRRGVREVVEDVDAITTKTNATLDTADGAAGDLAKLLRHADVVLKVNEDDLRATMTSARRTSREAEALARALRMQPSLLLLSKAPRERELP
jgi:phospholipid/cholesterol/gamma-HCH transport system substrate-binding protein